MSKRRTRSENSRKVFTTNISRLTWAQQTSCGHIEISSRCLLNPKEFAQVARDRRSRWATAQRSYPSRISQPDIECPSHLGAPSGVCPRLHLSEQYFTFSQSRTHFLRHSKGRLHRWQIFGSKPFLVLAFIVFFFWRGN